MSGEGKSTEGTDTDYRVIKTTAVPEVSEVRVYDETLPHLGDGHPELRNLIPSLEFAIHDTISQPTEVYASNPPHVNSFKFRSDNHLHGDNPMVVAVKVVEGTSALFKTAYFPSEVSGQLVWKENSKDD